MKLNSSLSQPFLEVQTAFGYGSSTTFGWTSTGGYSSTPFFSSHRHRVSVLMVRPNPTDWTF